MDPDQPNRCKPKNISRAANRVRAKVRPDEPRDLEFEINMQYLDCDDFLVADIRVNTERHMIFATSNQLRLLRQSKRWFMDGTFKVLLFFSFTFIIDHFGFMKAV